MDDELERYHKSNAGLDEVMGTLHQRIDELLELARITRADAKLQELAIERLVKHHNETASLTLTIERLVKHHNE